MKQSRGGYGLLATAIIKQAVIDVGPDYLKTEYAEYLKDISNTNDNDYKTAIKRWENNKEKQRQRELRKKELSLKQSIDTNNA